MSIFYRLKKKELVLLLDLFGDAGSLEQKFGDIYIDRDEYDRTAASLERKGFVSLNGKNISAESGMEIMLKSIFSAPAAFADEQAENWLYFSDGLIVTVRADSAFGPEFYLGAAADEEDMKLLSERITGRRFKAIRGKGEFCGEKLSEYAGGQNLWNVQK
jgi:hypothetical protein